MYMSKLFGTKIVTLPYLIKGKNCFLGGNKAGKFLL